jgi:hypothetical protein
MWDTVTLAQPLMSGPDEMHDEIHLAAAAAAVHRVQPPAVWRRRGGGGGGVSCCCRAWLAAHASTFPATVDPCSVEMCNAVRSGCNLPPACSKGPCTALRTVRLAVCRACCLSNHHRYTEPDLDNVVEGVRAFDGKSCGDLVAQWKECLASPGIDDPDSAARRRLEDLALSLRDVYCTKVSAYVMFSYVSNGDSNDCWLDIKMFQACLWCDTIAPSWQVLSDDAYH